MQSDKIKVHLGTKIVSINGYVGNFNIIAKTNGEEINFDVGTIIVATGGQEYKPTEYLYGKDMRILTQHELEQQIFENKINSKKVVMIQCVGSRNSERPYCSRICCSVAIKNALKLKEKDPNIEIFILYRDIRTYGFAEEYYELARKNGITFIRFNENSEPNVNKIENNLVVSVNNILSGKNFTIEPDLIVLSTAFLAADSKELSQMLKVPLDESGFFLEAHVKLRPLDFSTDGIFLCGAAQWPKFIKESISQANGAAARAIRLLSAKKIKTDAIIASVDMELCMGCRSCEWICPFSAIQVQRTDQGLKAIVIQSACKGCGVCGASCPQKAISMGHFTDNQLNQQLFALTDGLLE